MIFPIIILASLLKGVAGNTLPLALAGIADTQDKNYRFSFALSSGTYAIAYLLLIFTTNIFNKLIIILFPKFHKFAYHLLFQHLFLQVIIDYVFLHILLLFHT